MEIADFLEMDDVSFRPYAYRKAASVIYSLEKDVEEIYREKGIKGLEDISGVGKSIAQLIEEYIKKGKIKYYQQIKKKIPVDIKNLLRVEGIGPKTIKVLYQELQIKNLNDLKKAALNHKIAVLFNFDEKTEKNILEGIKFLEKSKGRIFLGEALPLAEEIEKKIKKINGVKEISTAGSLRRRKETVGDIDFLIVSEKPEKIADFLNSFPGKEKIIGEGKTKISIRMKDGFDIDFRIVPLESYGSALQYFTGSKEHNILLRKEAIKKGLKINEYGIFRKNKKIGGKNEEEIYHLVGMSWIPPEIREGGDEIKKSFMEFQKKSNGLPELVELKNIKGDLHCHSTWSGGENTIHEMAQEAIKMGYKYIGIADHTQYLRIENGLDEKRLSQQRKEINELNSKLETPVDVKTLAGRQKSKFKILQGCEANILKDGSLDIKDSAFKKLDFVIAGIHSHFKMNEKEMTERMIKAMKNPLVNIISHPTGRILGKREEYKIDFNKILRVAKETDTVLEINAHPQRLDLKDLNIRRVKESGVKMIINTDAHHKSQMKFMELGVSQARRGWAEKKDILNTSENLEFRL